MSIFINVKDLDKTNLKTLHELRATQENTIKFFQHLKLLPTKPNDKDSYSKKYNDWHLARLANRGDEGMCRMKISTILLFSVDRIFISL